MNMDSSHGKQMMMLTLLGGAAIGAIAMALTTPKSGREVRDTLRTSALRLFRKSDGSDELDTGTIDAAFI